jgi:exodeoxyribonuclease III
MTVLSWNVNGIRAVLKKNFLGIIADLGADVVCLQETKIQERQLPEELLAIPGYNAYWSFAEKAGYSGVAIFAREEPDEVEKSGVPEVDVEGRVLRARFGDINVISAYFPNSQAEGKRLPYKLSFGGHIKELGDSIVGRGQHLVLAGDYNIAHKPIDLANPKSNEKNPGYLPEERSWMEAFLSGGYVDSFRHFNREPNHYTWWSYRFNAREKNVGWRLDYHCVDEGLAGRLRSSEIRPDVYGSDHCPIILSLD